MYLSNTYMYSHVCKKTENKQSLLFLMWVKLCYWTKPFQENVLKATKQMGIFLLHVHVSKKYPLSSPKASQYIHLDPYRVMVALGPGGRNMWITWSLVGKRGKANFAWMHGALNSQSHVDPASMLHIKACLSLSNAALTHAVTSLSYHKSNWNKKLIRHKHSAKIAAVHVCYGVVQDVNETYTYSMYTQRCQQSWVYKQQSRT